ncbi:transglycosylase SLT domain-containing protein [Burkholderia contaminans]|uniref:transglycosylase SLT domain-containing protein n=1 Tax=Burkholderia contaminans TaxID=488447 RepID=UPI00118C8B20|nr:lytic transglycosylase domain-containing protein [Burkholderia contaminans]
MPTFDSAPIIETCAAGVDARLFTSLVRQESNFNPFAIGLDGKAVLKAQPRSYEEAVKTAVNLRRQGIGFSVGLSQVHISNVVRLKMTWQEAFDPCTNLRTGSEIFRGFYTQAVQAGYRSDSAVFAALRGFNSGACTTPSATAMRRRFSFVSESPPQRHHLPSCLRCRSGGGICSDSTRARR